MYGLLNYSERPHRAGLSLTPYRRPFMGLTQSVERIRAFRQDSPMGLHGEHLLAKLLQSLNVPLSLEPVVYSDKVSDITFNMARGMSLTSAVTVGSFITPGIFYGQNVSELIWLNIDPYDKSMLATRWRELQSIRVLYHPHTDLGLDVPDGRFTTEEGGWAVIAVNLPMLAAQYRQWRAERAKIEETVSARTVTQFLMEVPLPNMLYSHTDLVLLNRLICLSMGKPVSQARGHHTFALSDWSSDVDRVLKITLTYLEGTQYNFDEVLSAVPTVFADDIHQVLRLPDLAYISQLQPAVIASRAVLAAFLVQLNYLTDNTANRGYLRYLRIYLRQNHQSKFMSNQLPREHYEQLQAVLDQGIAPYL